MIENLEFDKKTAYKDYFSLAWPAAAEGFLIKLLTSVDLLMARSLGYTAQAAIGVVAQPMMVVTLFSRALSVGLTALIGRRFGQNRKKEIGIVFKNILFLSTIFYVLFMGLCIYNFSGILKIARASDSYYDMAMIYGRLIFISVVFQSLSTIISGALVALGQTKLIFFSNLSGNILNCLVNYMLVYGAFGLPKLGVFGLGLGTIIGSILSLAIMVYNIYADENLKHLLWTRDFKIDKENLKSLATITQATLGEQVFERTGMLLYTIMVTSLGPVYLAAHQILMTLCDIFYSLSMGLGTASASITSRLLGEEKKNLAYYYGLVERNSGLILGSLGLALYYFLKKPIFGLFTQDPQVLETGILLMPLVALVNIPQSLNLTMAGVLKGAGDVKFVALYSLIIIAFLRPLITYILIFILDMGLMGAWLSLCMDQSLRALCANLRFKSRKWQKIKI